MTNNITIWYAIKRLFPKIFSFSPLLSTFLVIVGVAHGISWVAIAVFTQEFIDKSTFFAQEGSPSQIVYRALIILGIIYLLNKIITNLFGVLYRMLGRQIQGKSSFMLYDKINRINPIFFEDTKKLEDIVKAQEGLNNSVWFILMIITVITFYPPYLIFMCSYLYMQKPILIIIVFIAFIPMIFSQLVKINIFLKLTDKIAPLTRKKRYFRDCITSIENFKETRQLGVYKYFYNLYLLNLKRENQERFKANIKSNLFELITKCITSLCYGVIFLLLFNAVINNEISIGVFAAVFYALDRLFASVKELVCDILSYLYKDLPTITNYLRFLEFPDRLGKDIVFKANEGIEIDIKNVSFRYPQTNEYALKGINLYIKKNETVALVGENGSGKTTLIRILTGLYNPTEGDVFINDINAKDMSMKSLFSKTSAVFQKYQKYHLTLKENISISDTDIPENETYVRLADSLSKSGLEQTNPIFDKGLDTMLSREYDGVDLSGGYWQRVAIARGYFRRHGFIVLDEPTAAIDPIEEMSMYSKFAEISKNNTAIVVTHRLGSAKIADRIVVMKDGFLVETGTHDELLQKEGEYARLYKTQNQWYT